jgi:hypothetical protein
MRSFINIKADRVKFLLLRDKITIVKTFYCKRRDVDSFYGSVAKITKQKIIDLVAAAIPPFN